MDTFGRTPALAKRIAIRLPTRGSLSGRIRPPNSLISNKQNMRLTLPLVSTLDNRPLQDIHRFSASSKAIDAVDDLSPLVSLHALILSNNELGDGESLAGVRHCSSLTLLELNGNKFTQCPPGNHLNGLSLKVLNMSHNAIDRITHNFTQMSHSLAALILNNNQLKILDASLFANCSNLNTLIISHNELTEFPVLPSLKNLKTLSIAHNKLRLVPDISQYASLKQLRLNNNKIASISSSHIQSMQTVWANLDLLDIGNNKITTEALDALQQLRLVTNLNLKGNPLATHYPTEEYQPTLSNLLPSLRILDGSRFDPAFLGRKQKRLALELKRRIKEEKAKPDGRKVKKQEVFKEPKALTASETEEQPKKLKTKTEKPKTKSGKLVKPSKLADTQESPKKRKAEATTESPVKKPKTEKPVKKPAEKVVKPIKKPEAESKAVKPRAKNFKNGEDEAHKSGVIAIVPVKTTKETSFDPAKLAASSNDLNVASWD